MTKLGPRWKMHGQLGERTPKTVSSCGCGRNRTLRQFRQLQHVGNMCPDDGQEPTTVEQRNCNCGSTIAIDLDVNGAIWEYDNGN